MTEPTEYDVIADRAAESLRKYLPDLGKPGGLARLAIKVPAPLGGKLFPGREREEVRVTLVVYTDPHTAASK